MNPRAAWVMGLLSLSAGALAAGDSVVGLQKSVACQACHGADGNSTNPQFPPLVGQYPDYIVHALTEYQNGDRKNPVMAPMAANLSQQDMEDLAAYFSTRPAVLFTRP